MKKIITIALLVLISTSIFAKKKDSGFGIVAGANFSTANYKDIKIDQASFNNFHAGIIYKLDLPLGLSIQPGLQYSVKGANIGGYIPAGETVALPGNLKVEYLEVPVSIQWGPDLILFRPFLDCTPFVGYALNNKLTLNDLTGASTPSDIVLNKLSYGVGLGVGVEVWKFQLVGRYNWNMGSLSDGIDQVGVTSFEDYVMNEFSGGNFGGISLSLAFIF